MLFAFPKCYLGVLCHIKNNDLFFIDMCNVVTLGDVNFIYKIVNSYR